MKSIYTLCIACSVLLTFAGCKKSSDNKSKTKTEIISQSSWKIDNAKVSGIDVTSSLDACEIDNILTFSSNGTGTLDEGATKCDASDPQSNPFSWNFASNETMLHISTVVI